MRRFGASWLSRISTCRQSSQAIYTPLGQRSIGNSLCTKTGAVEHNRKNMCNSTSSTAEGPVLTKPTAAMVNDSPKPTSLEIMESQSCRGCGIDLQFSSPTHLGYCPPERIKNLEGNADALGTIMCQRCSQIRNYGKLPPIYMPYEEYEKSVKEVRAHDAIVLQVIDVLDISNSLLPHHRHLIGQKDVIFIVSKWDLVPLKSGKRRVLRRIQQFIKELDIQNVVNIHFVSSTKKSGIHDVMKDIQEFRRGRDICVIGAANAGKSSFLNVFLGDLEKRFSILRNPTAALYGDAADDDDEYEGSFYAAEDQRSKDSVIYGTEEELDEILRLQELESDSNNAVKKSVKGGNTTTVFTESPFPGTTLAATPIALPTNGSEIGTVWDTPGIITDTKRQKLMEILSSNGMKELSRAIPTKKMDITTFRVSPGRSLFLGSLARIDYIRTANDERKDCRLLFSWFGALPGHLTKTTGALDILVKHAGGLLSPPRGLDAVSLVGGMEERMTVELTDFVNEGLKTKSKLRKPKRTSVVEIEFPGFGWLTISAVDLDGSGRALDTVCNSSIAIHTVDGMTAAPRACLFPYEFSDSTRAQWKT